MLWPLVKPEHSDLTCKCKSVMKDILLQTEVSQKKKHGQNDKKKRKKVAWLPECSTNPAR